jgi:hypothetical protein
LVSGPSVSTSIAVAAIKDDLYDAVVDEIEQFS